MNGPDLAHTDSGVPLAGAAAGLPLLLVHGWGSDSRTWSACLPAFAERHRVVTVDVRGHGRSAVTIDGYDPETIAEDLAAVIAELGLGRSVAVGHSWGGQLVTALAVTRPDLVAGLVVLDPAYGAVSETALRDQLVLWKSDDATAALLDFAEGAFGSQTPEDVRDQVRAGFRQTERRALVEAFVAMYLTDHAFGLLPATQRYLAGITAPTLSVFSDESAAGWARSLLAPPGSRVVCWPEAGHYLHQEYPARLVALVETWLGEFAQHVERHGGGGCGSSPRTPPRVLPPARVEQHEAALRADLDGFLEGDGPAGRQIHG